MGGNNNQGAGAVLPSPNCKHQIATTTKDDEKNDRNVNMVEADDDYACCLLFAGCCDTFLVPPFTFLRVAVFPRSTQSVPRGITANDFGGSCGTGKLMKETFFSLLFIFQAEEA